MSEEALDISFHSSIYDGPIETILELIKKNQLNIYDLDISVITSEFLKYIEENKERIEVNELSSFYHTAAELLYIKSRLLLPVETEMDEDYEDPRAELVERLIEFQVYKKYVDALSGGTADKLYVSRNENFFAVPFDDEELFEGVSLHNLLETFVILASRTRPAKIFNVYEEVTTDEKKALIIEQIDMYGKTDVESVIVKLDSPMHIACTFLALLELVHMHIIIIRQEVQYGTIVIEKRPDGWITEPKDEEELRASKKRPLNNSILIESEETRILTAEIPEVTKYKERIDDVRIGLGDPDQEDWDDEDSEDEEVDEEDYFDSEDEEENDFLEVDEELEEMEDEEDYEEEDDDEEDEDEEVKPTNNVEKENQEDKYFFGEESTMSEVEFFEILDGSLIERKVSEMKAKADKIKKVKKSNRSDNIIDDEEDDEDMEDEEDYETEDEEEDSFLEVDEDLEEMEDDEDEEDE